MPNTPEPPGPLGDLLQQLMQMFGAAEPPMQKIPKFDWSKIPRESLDGPTNQQQGGGAMPGPDLNMYSPDEYGASMKVVPYIETTPIPPHRPYSPPPAPFQQPARPYSPTPYTAQSEWVGPINPPQPGYHYDWSKAPKANPDLDPWNRGRPWDEIKRRMGV